MGNMYTCFQTTGTKALPDGAVHTYTAYIREYPPPQGSNTQPFFFTKDNYHKCMSVYTYQMYFLFFYTKFLSDSLSTKSILLNQIKSRSVA